MGAEGAKRIHANLSGKRTKLISLLRMICFYLRDRVLCTVPFLVICEEENVLEIIKLLMNYGDIEILFDAVNKSGMTMMQKKHMKTVGHEDAKMFFYVNSATELAAKIDRKVKVLAEERFYIHTSKKGLKLSTKLSMVFSDWLGMVKMIHLSL